ncbi:hypothetical protein CEE45_05805 [Candidatus Heimdallarchaeota archaeon B3_Heim]|nr:MAG: hypothetical protein CEE45_05805 [Candidatus Heimdallarchaeota archaeon B3_Heim]
MAIIILILILMLSSNSISAKKATNEQQESSYDLYASTFLGGFGDDIVWDNTVDEEGYIYLTGTTDSPLFPVTPNAANSTYGGSDDAFLVKMDPFASTVLYATFWGGSSYDVGYAITLDSIGNIYIGGFTQSVDFPLSIGAYNSTKLGSHKDGFIAKFDPYGQMLYSTLLGSVTTVQSLTVLADDSIVAGGLIKDIDFLITSANAYDQTLGASEDGYIFCLSADGSTLVYSSYIGGAQNEIIMDIDAVGDHVVFTGETRSADLEVMNAEQTQLGSTNVDAFVGRLNILNGQMNFLTYWGGNMVDIGKAVYIDDDGDVCVVGKTESRDFPFTFNAYDPSLYTGFNVFVTHFLSNGSVAYSSFAGSVSGIYDIAPLSDKRVAFVGTGSDLPTTPNAYYDGTGGFFAILATDRPYLHYCSYLSEGTNSPFSVTIGEGETIYLAGYTTSPSFPTTNGCFDPTFVGANDGFLTIFTPSIATLSVSLTSVLVTNLTSAFLFSVMDTTTGLPLSSVTVTGTFLIISYPAVETIEGSYLLIVPHSLTPELLVVTVQKMGYVTETLVLTILMDVPSIIITEVTYITLINTSTTNTLTNNTLTTPTATTPESTPLPGIIFFLTLGVVVIVKRKRR